MKTELLNSEINENLKLPSNEEIKWLSPLVDDEYAEYRDQDFIRHLGVKLEKFALADFWPERGPQWDALGKSSTGKLFLVEAKSHIAELISTLQAEDSNSKSTILESLRQTQRFLKSNEEIDWFSRFYQYTNRLAHLYLLRSLNQLPAYLVFVYFVNDFGMKGPTTVYEWKGALSLLHSYLGIRRHRLQRYVADVFIDVKCLDQDI